MLHQLIRAHPLATLVTLAADGLAANHIPMEIEPGGALGVLRGHVSRAATRCGKVAPGSTSMRWRSSRARRAT